MCWPYHPSLPHGGPLFVSLQGFCSQHEILRSAHAFIDTFECLRNDLPDLPPEGLRPSIDELLFSRQQDEITVAEHSSPFDVELEDPHGVS